MSDEDKRYEKAWRREDNTSPVEGIMMLDVLLVSAATEDRS